MSVVSSVSSLATRIGNEIRDAVKPRLLPSGGTTGQVLNKTSGTNYAVGWTSLGTGASKNIHVGTTAPASPAEGDVWIDTN
ncbi:hypothetical protein [Sinorhizobium meliloti]|uniref:hypothetical protein n=1 Tax=Rhizobium meliloti TaxID=382 RepID=UPI003D65AB54